jgi:hypothetical protein
MTLAKEVTTSDSTRPGRIASVWLVSLVVAAAVVVAIAASARTNGAVGLWSRRLVERVPREFRALFHRAEKRADRTGRHVQDAVEVIGETAADLAHGSDPLSE